MALQKKNEWKIDFLRLSYPTEDTKDIAALLNQKPTAICSLCRYHNISKINIELDLTNKQFGRLNVISKYSGKKKYKETMWNCICDCETKVIISTWGLLNRKTVSCGCLRLEVIDSGYGNIPGWYYGQTKKQAKYRNIDFNVTIEQLDELWIKQNGICALTKIPLKINRKNIRVTKGDTTASLDRIDSTKSYTIDNVQWIHKDVNIMKSSYNEPYFLLICNLIAGTEKIENINLEQLQTNRRYNRKLFHNANSN